MSALGIVIIGRNEGERLGQCLASVAGIGPTVVYVDSNSSDGSVALARTMGAEVVELDLSRPFTAARARNVGFARLEAIDRDVQFVQFLDGDCEVVSGWLARACATLEERPEVGVVCGRLRERFPDHSIYNRLADLEWDTPLGEIQACGGIAMIRAEVFRAVGGFNPDVIAAEDDELCLRIRRAGSRIVRLDAQMALHDMAMTRFGPWWKRTVRTGHAYAEGVARHGRSPDRHFVRQLNSVILWGTTVPLLALGLAWPTRGISLVLLAGYPLLLWRIYRYGIRRGWSANDARLYAFWCIVGKLPQALGAFRYALGRLSGGPPRLIEHKGPVEPASSSVGS
jgi:GT2 family glycosyltransferase